jgi:centromere protein S
MASGTVSGGTTEEEGLVKKQRLKAALHYAIGKKYEDVALDNGLTVNRQVMAATNELVYKLCTQLSTDLELFAKHGKRSTINNDDVMLYCRRNPTLSQLINEEIKSVHNEGDSKGKKKKSVVMMDISDDENEQ